MFLIYFLAFIVNTKICWSYLVLPFDDSFQVPLPGPPNFKDVGEPLILTPYIKSNQISKARELSSVESLLNDKPIVSNSGYFTVDEKYNSNLFFWFFRKNSSDWQKAPLILWLQGGPGCSSMYGLFEEHGPFEITEDGLNERNYSWANHYNVLYIDQPVGTGFSFTNSSDGYVSTQTEVAHHLYEALTQFFRLYSELKNNALYIAGESYAGRFIPSISYKIHNSNKLAYYPTINLKGLFMISASTNGGENGLAKFYFQIGVIDSQTRTELEILEQTLQFCISSKFWTAATLTRSALLQGIQLKSGIDFYDFTKTLAARISDKYVPFLNESSTRKKIHVGNAIFSSCHSDKTVYKHLIEDISTSALPYIEDLLDHYPIAFVGGQYDAVVAYPVVVNVLENLNFTGAPYYKTAKRRILGGENLDGYYKSGGNLKDILIRNAGHMVPHDQPRATLDLLHKFVNDELW
ncbi:hypothetical protein V9T40_011603 [Parthenolecanium corni]|uniref:Carboxypeptidase n=1 Tax=Parthenolecanium corni TaxID=536013 RepID=A0AAN9T5N1_9HEMI